MADPFYFETEATEADDLACAWVYTGYHLAEIAAGFLGWQRRATQAEARVKELEDAIRTHKKSFATYNNFSSPEDHALWAMLGKEED